MHMQLYIVPMGKFFWRDRYFFVSLPFQHSSLWPEKKSLGLQWSYLYSCHGAYMVRARGICWRGNLKEIYVRINPNVRRFFSTLIYSDWMQLNYASIRPWTTKTFFLSVWNDVSNSNYFYSRLWHFASTHIVLLSKQLTSPILGRMV